MSKTTILAACGALMLGAVQAMGAVIIDHNGSTDPVTESPAWTLAANGTGTAGSGVTHLGEPAWKMTDPVGGGNGAKYMYGSVSTTDFDDPNGWSVKWRMAGANLKDATGDDEATLRIFDGHYAFGFTLRVNGAGAGDGATLRQRYGNVALKSDIPTIASRATGFHDFEFIFDPSGGLYSLYVDNVFVTDSNATPALLSVPVGSASFGWGGFDGNESDDREVDSYWNFVELSTIPEPSSLSLLFAAALPMLRRKR